MEKRQKEAAKLDAIIQKLIKKYHLLSMGCFFVPTFELIFVRDG